MTVSNTTNRVSYTGDGASTVFSFPAKFLSAADLKVYVGGLLKTLTSDYTVGTPTDTGANVTLLAAPAVGVSIVIVRDPDLLQQSKLPSTGPFPALTVEQMSDKSTLQIQRLHDLVDRSIRLDDSDASVTSLLLPAPQATNLLGWNASATALANYDIKSLATTVVYGQAAGDMFMGDGVKTAFTLTQNPGSLYNLDVDIAGVTQHPGADFTWSGGTTLTMTVPVPLGAILYVRYSQALPNVPKANYPTPADYGAVGDNVADDTTALAQLHAANLVVDYGGPGKTYKVSGTITLRDKTIILGSGAQVTQTVLQTPIYNCVGKSDVKITGVTLNGVSMSTATAGSFVPGRKYSIISVGTTDFTLIGASSNTPGVFFTATGAGTGTGTASTFYNTPNSLDIGIKADRAVNLTVAGCTFNNFAYSPLMVALWGTNIKFRYNVVNGPGSSVLNPLNLPDPQVPGFRNCTGATILGYGVEIHGCQFKDTSQGFIVGQQSRDVAITNNNVLGTVVEHGMYCDNGVQHVRIANNSFSKTKLLGGKVQGYDSVMAATAMIAGGTYTIVTLGTTDFTTVGAASNTVGLTFTATAAGTGTGTVSFPQTADITVVGNTFENTGGDGFIVLNASQQVVATINGVTQASPGVFSTVADHGLAVNEVINISGVLGMTPVNAMFYVASTPTSKTFTVKVRGVALSTASFPAYTSGGTITKPSFARGVTIVGNTFRNIGQDAIGVRFVDGCAISGNTVDTVSRTGVYAQYVRKTDVNNNILRDLQLNAAYMLSPVDQCSFTDNTIIAAGLAGNDTNGQSSGIALEGDGGVEIGQNTFIGEETQTKMQYCVYILSGDKRAYTLRNNTGKWSRDAGVRFHANDSYSLQFIGGNTWQSAAGDDVYVGLPAGPSRGDPYPEFHGTAAPTTGTWNQGSRVKLLYPDVGQPTHVVSTVAGTPGTWNPAGKVHKVAATQALSGTYTPTLTNASNTTILTAQQCMWRVDGDRVIVTGRVNIQPTSNGSLTRFNMSLPISSDLTTSSFATLFGTFASASNQMAGAIYNPGSGAQQNTAQFDCNASTTSQVFIMFQFEYILK